VTRFRKNEHKVNFSNSSACRREYWLLIFEKQIRIQNKTRPEKYCGWNVGGHLYYYCKYLITKSISVNGL
jgi:hypothetical protein